MNFTVTSQHHSWPDRSSWSACVGTATLPSTLAVIQQLLTCTTHGWLYAQSTLLHRQDTDINCTVTAQHNSLPFKIRSSCVIMLAQNYPDITQIMHHHSTICIVEVQHHALVCTRIQRLVKPTCRTGTAARVDRAAHANSYTLQISFPKYAHWY